MCGLLSEMPIFESECFRLNTCIMWQGVGGNRTDPGREEQAGIVWLPSWVIPMVESGWPQSEPRIHAPYHPTRPGSLLAWGPWSERLALGLEESQPYKVCLRYDTPPPSSTLAFWSDARAWGKRGQLILQRGAPTCPLTAVEGYMEAWYYRPRGSKWWGWTARTKGVSSFPAADMCTVCPRHYVFPLTVMVEVSSNKRTLKGLPRTLGGKSSPLGLFSLDSVT